VFTAQNPNSLIEKLGHVLQRFGQISSLAYFACQTQRDFAAQRVSSHSVTSVRLVVIATDLANLQQKLEQAFATLKESAQTSFSLLQGIYYGVDMNPGKVMMMFPGQGSQYCGMGADLAMAFKACGNVWDNASRLSFNQENSLREIVFPPPTFSFQERQGYEQRLTEPVWAQPALASASMAQFHLLKQLSIKPDCMLGHSFGEITALCAAGVMDETALFAIAKKRGELMQQAAPSASAMLSVSYPIEKTLAFIKAHHLAVTPANFNAPNQLVLSGSQEAITMAESLLAQEKINSRRLMVGAAFHSPFMESAYKPFRKFLDTLTFHAPQTPVYANLTAKPYPVKVKQIKEMLAKQLTHPVLFNAQIDYAYEQGVRSFIEVGSNNVLTGLVKQCLGKREFHAIYLDHKGEKGVTALWHALGRMITIGLNPDLMTLWEEYALPEEMPPKSSDRYVVKINGSNYAKPYPRSTTVAKPMSTIGVMPQVDAKVSVLKDRARHSSDNFYHHLSDKENTMSNQTNPYLLQMYQNLQQQLIESYNLYQKAMTESHTQFLNAINYLARQAEAANQTAMQSYPNAHTQPVMSNFNLQPNMPSPLSMHRANNSGFDHGSVQLNSSSQPLPQASIPHAAPPVFNFQQPLQSPQPISHYTNHGGISNVQMNPTVQPLSQSPMSHVAASALNIPSAASSSPEAMGFSGQLNQMNVEDLLLEIVVDKTGYPRQMLTMDMTIETELGIDSIKRVEILSAVTQRIPNLPEINPDKLAQLKTLGDIAAYMREHV
jgi:acyl transferase domain-containing protein